MSAKRAVARAKPSKTVRAKGKKTKSAKTAPEKAPRGKAVMAKEAAARRGRSDGRAGVAPSGAAVMGKPAKAAKTAKPAKPAPKPVKPAKAAKPVKVVKPVKVAKPPKPAKPVKVAKEEAARRGRSDGRAEVAPASATKPQKVVKAPKAAAKPPEPPAPKVAPPAPEEQKMKMTEPESAPPAKPRAVLRIAAGERRPKQKREEEAAREANAQNVHPALRNGPVKAIRRVAAPKVELNPKLESSRGVIAPAEPAKERPMSVAQKNRAAAEAAFSRVAPAAAVAPPPPPEARPHASGSNGAVGPAGPSNTAQPHKSQFEMRISERDTLTSTLRFSESRDMALQAARELAERFRLPPDQTLLVRVIGLADPTLTKLALEELLELDDRGRVRRTPELRDALDKLRSDDRETLELKELLLEKIGAFGG